jgi:hypothetical protein
MWCGHAFFGCRLVSSVEGAVSARSARVSELSI